MFDFRSSAAKLVLAASALTAASVLTACGSSGHPAASATTATSQAGVPTTTISPATTVAPTTTAPPSTVPPDPQPSAEQASSTFMQGWIAGDRAQSRTVATPAAVATLYAAGYQGQSLNDRGCSDAFPPIICTWGPYAGGSGSIYEVQLTQVGRSWYVSGVTVDS